MHFHADVNDESQSLVALVVSQIDYKFEVDQVGKKSRGYPRNVSSFSIRRNVRVSTVFTLSDWIFNGYFPKRLKFVGRWMVRAKLTQSAGLI